VILAIETSTDICSVALLRGSEVVALREGGGSEHARLLAVYIDEVLREAGIAPSALEAVAVSAGPGSYTGLRIGLSTAKGLCYALGIPLIAVGSLDALAAQVAGRFAEGTLLRPMIDARRMEVYTQLFDHNARPLGEVEAVVIDENSFDEDAETADLVIFGSGAAKCAQVLSWATFIEVGASARGLARGAAEAFAARRFVDTAYFDPLYLKDFVATAPKKRVFKN
jgi:tRNA threonylcarbamoyladenosine biosynthesis protein TsaB